MKLKPITEMSNNADDTGPSLTRVLKSTCAVQKQVEILKECLDALVHGSNAKKLESIKKKYGPPTDDTRGSLKAFLDFLRVLNAHNDMFHLPFLNGDVLSIIFDYMSVNNGFPTRVARTLSQPHIIERMLVSQGTDMPVPMVLLVIEYAGNNTMREKATLVNPTHAQWQCYL